MKRQTNHLIDLEILKESIMSKETLQGFFAYLIIVAIGIYNYNKGNIGITSIIKGVLIFTFIPLLAIINCYLDGKKKKDIENKEYKERITYSSDQTPPTPPQSERIRNTAGNSQERPTEAQQQNKEYQDPPKKERPTERHTGGENTRQTERPRQTVHQEDKNDRQKHKENIINNTDFFSEEKQTKGQQTQATQKETIESIINDFETLFNAGVYSTHETGGKQRIVKNEKGENVIIDTDDEGVPLWFKEMFKEAMKGKEQANTTNEEHQKQIFFEHFKSIGFSRDFNLFECDYNHLLKFKNIISLMSIIFNDDEIGQNAKESRLEELYIQGLDVINEFFSVLINKNTGVLLSDYVLNPNSSRDKSNTAENSQERPTEAQQQNKEYQDPPKGEKSTARPKWGAGGETGEEKPKQGRGRPKKG